MKYLIFCLIVISVFGCSKPNHPPLEYMSEQSRLPLVNADSVEYFKVKKKDFWDWGQSYPFVTIIYFKNKDYKKILKRVSRDSTYDTYEEEKERVKSFNVYYKRFLVPAPQCSMDKPMYRFVNFHRALDEIIIFCNRVYFSHANRTPFDDVPKKDKDE